MNTKALATLPLLFVVACGGGGGGGGSSSAAAATPHRDAPPLADPIATDPSPPGERDPERIGSVPELVSVETLADSGLQVGYTRESQRERVDPRYIAAQWGHMQRCVGLVAPAPLVIVVDGAVEPLLTSDDVIRDLEGRVVASASPGADGIATMQVSESDFDGSIGNVGFSTRSIMGRHLWLSAMLAERDYPFRCARTEATLPSPPNGARVTSRAP